MGPAGFQRAIWDSANEIFVGGLLSYINKEQVMEPPKSFGELKAINLVCDNKTGLLKVCAHLTSGPSGPLAGKTTMCGWVSATT
jgi:hypothetical protein